MTIDPREGEAVAFKNISPDSLDGEQKVALQALVAEKGAAYSREGDQWFIQTQELNPKKIGPFDSDRSAQLFAGSNPDAKKALLSVVEDDK